jgi:acetyl esterase/lipase
MPGASALRPTPVQRLMRRSGFRNHLFPPDKLDRWAANPRVPYVGAPPALVRRRAEITRADLDGRPVYQVVPDRIADAPRRGHMLYLHGGGYVGPLVPLNTTIAMSSRFCCASTIVCLRLIPRTR